MNRSSDITEFDIQLLARDISRAIYRKFGSKLQEISRFVAQGRNFGLSYVALTQRLASVDSNLVEISGLKYFGKTEGDNNRRKAKAWLPKEYLNKARDLQTGEFLQQYGSKITLQRVPLFQSPKRPQPYIEPTKPKKPTLMQRIIRAVVGA